MCHLEYQKVRAKSRRKNLKKRPEPGGGGGGAKVSATRDRHLESSPWTEAGLAGVEKFKEILPQLLHWDHRGTSLHPNGCLLAVVEADSHRQLGELAYSSSKSL